VSAQSSAPRSLERVVGVPGAVAMGLGSILGTGIFVSLGVAAGVAGAWVVPAVALAALVAIFNGLSSAQLAANHPVSGGTYEYGYRVLNPTLGFVAGWMFLCAKSASAATAALGLAGYVLTAAGREHGWERVAMGLLMVGVVTAIVGAGMQRSNRANVVILVVTLLALGTFVLAGVPEVAKDPLASFRELHVEGARGLLHGTALMFVAYTGYGRIATLGEEVRNPKKSIPRAIIVTLVLTMVLYVSVAVVAVTLVGTRGLAEATRTAAAPLQMVAEQVQVPAVAWLVAVGAVTAMTGVLLNLSLGLSRVLLAMGRRGDMPRAVAKIDERGSPRRAVLVVGLFIGALVLIGRVETTWSFSAFTVLVYYAITNLAALRLPAEQRRYPRFVAALGLISCLGLAFWVEPFVWAVGLGLIGIGICWRWVVSSRRRLG
jgi:basic amino acid/polyamine antiporter, APA family